MRNCSPVAVSSWLLLSLPGGFRWISWRMCYICVWLPSISSLHDVAPYLRWNAWAVLGGFFQFSLISMYHVASFFWVQKQRKIQLYQRYPLWSCCGNSRKTSQNFSAEASLPRLLSEREGLAVELPSNQALVGSPEEKILHLSPWIIHECTERNTITHPSKSKSRNKNYSAAVLGSSYNSWSDIMTI